MARHRDGPDWDAFFKKRDALREEIESVIQAAGIERCLERLEDDLMPDWFEDQVLPSCSPMPAQIERREQ